MTDAAQKAEAEKAMSMGSLPSMPELPPPPPLDPKDELVAKIKARGAFFLGVDVPVNTSSNQLVPPPEDAKK